MTVLSDVSLRNTLEPAVAVMDAFKKASSWQAVTAAWRASKRLDRIYCGILFSFFLISAVASVGLNNVWLFGLAVILGIAGPLVLRCRIVDRHPLRDTYGRLDRYFGLNYRFRRYLSFRDALQKAGINPCILDRARKILTAEARLQESRRPRLGFAVTAVVSIVVAIPAILSTREYLLASRLLLLILVIYTVGLYFYFLWKNLFPGHRYSEQELTCFLIWYEEECAAVERGVITCQDAC